MVAKSDKNPEPKQYVFSSSADDSSFEVYLDPRGNTLGRGTEITLVLKDDALEYLDTHRLTELMYALDLSQYSIPLTFQFSSHKHSSFASSFPVYLFTQRTEEVPDEDEQLDEVTLTSSSTPTEDSTPIVEVETKDEDEDEVIVEEVDEKEEEKKEPEAQKMKKIVVDEWVQMNPQAPIWMRWERVFRYIKLICQQRYLHRDTKTVTNEEYELFYQSTFKDYDKPLAWHHFSGDSGSGVSFRAILYIPSRLWVALEVCRWPYPRLLLFRDDSFWQSGPTSASKDVRLMVKRVFITNDLGDDALPKWASWVKVVIDGKYFLNVTYHWGETNVSLPTAEDLPLNVSRETLQSTKFLKQLKSIITRHLVQTLTRLQDDKKEKFEEVKKVYNNVFKLGAVEDTKNREKLSALVRFPTNQRNSTSLTEVMVPSNPLPTRGIYDHL